MRIDCYLRLIFGGPFKNYTLRLLGLEGSNEYDTDSIQDDEQFIGVLCFCQNNVRCAELLCYFTTFQSTHNAFGFHCYTHPQHRQQGLNKALLHIAVCLLPVFKSRLEHCKASKHKPLVVGCQSINPIVFHNMETYLGCTIKHEETYHLKMRDIRKKCNIHPPPLPTEYDENTVCKLDDIIRKMFNNDTFRSGVPLLSTKAVQTCPTKVSVNRLVRTQFEKHCVEYEEQCGQEKYIQLMQDQEDITPYNKSLCTNCAFNIAGYEMDVCCFVQKHMLHTLCWSDGWRYVLSLCPNCILIETLRNWLHYQLQL